MHVAKKETLSAAPARPVAESDLTRRDFIKGGVLAAGVAGGVGLGAAYFGYGASVPNPLRVGIIGTGDEGNVLIGAINPNYVQVVAIADIRPYNIYRAFHGDDSSENAAKVRPGLLKEYGWATESQARKTVKVYDDEYAMLLDDPNVEAVIIALPLHLHAEASIKALRKGKHVLCEKLMAHSVHEAKEMAQVAAQTGKLLAVGHQRHYSILYDNAAEAIRRGLIGDVHHIRAQWHRGNLPGNDSWQQDLPDDKLQEEAARYARESQEALDELTASPDNLAEWKRRAETLAVLTGEPLPRWNSALAGERDRAEFERRQRIIKLMDQTLDPKKYGYADFELSNSNGKPRKVTAMEELVRWRLWNRTGGGLMAELGSHQLDAASIFVSALRDDHTKVQPLSVFAVGGRHIFPHDRDIEDHVYCMFEFPGPGYYADVAKRTIGDPNKKIVVTYSSINGNGFGGYGEAVMGTTGTLLVEREEKMSIVAAASQAKTTIQAAKGDGGPTLDTTESGGPRVATRQGASGPVSRGYTEEIEHWAWCIRNPAPENRPRCHPQVALADAVIALVSNIAIRGEKPIEFKPEWFDIKSPETPEGIAPDPARYKS